MRLRGPNNIGRAVQTDPTLLRYSLAIMGQTKCLKLLDRFQILRNNSQQHATIRNNMQQGVQTDATCNIQQFRELLANNSRSVYTGPVYDLPPRCNVLPTDLVLIPRYCLYSSVDLIVATPTWPHKNYYGPVSSKGLKLLLCSKYTNT